MNVEPIASANEPNVPASESCRAHSVAPPRRPPAVVVVEDNIVWRTRLLSQLALRPGTTLLGLGCSEFSDLAEHLRPSVVLANPTPAQVQSLSQVLAQFSHCPAILVGPEASKALRRYLTKKARIVQVMDYSSTAELCDRINDCLPAIKRVSAPFTLAEYVQLAGLGGHSVRLVCEGVDGRHLGEVHMVDGQLRAAYTNDSSGFEAFADLVIQTDLAIHFAPVISPTLQVDLSSNWQSLILKAMTQADERTRSESPKAPVMRTPIVAGELAPQVSEAPVSLDMLKRAAEIPALPVTGMRDALASVGGGLDKGARELIEEGVRAIIDKEYSRAIQMLQEASKLEPKNRAIRHQLKRLYSICSPEDAQLMQTEDDRESTP